MKPTTTQLAALHSYLRRLTVSLNSNGVTWNQLRDMECGITETTCKAIFKDKALAGKDLKNITRSELADAMEKFEAMMNQNGMDTFIGNS